VHIPFQWKSTGFLHWPQSALHGKECQRMAPTVGCETCYSLQIQVLQWRPASCAAFIYKPKHTSTELKMVMSSHYWIRTINHRLKSVLTHNFIFSFNRHALSQTHKAYYILYIFLYHKVEQTMRNHITLINWTVSHLVDHLMS